MNIIFLDIKTSYVYIFTLYQLISRDILMGCHYTLFCMYACVLIINNKPPQKDKLILLALLALYLLSMT
jgi:hypothetical protein